MKRKEKWLCEVKKEYNSLEEYIANRNQGGAEPLLFGYHAFNYLWKNNLLKQGDIIRTNLQGNHIDGHYRINSKGKLEGIEAARGVYSGKPGIHNPRKILNTKVSDNGWTIDFFAKSRIIYKL
jgi:hypothetical protein